MKIICTICARGGSQGVKNKNIIFLKGKPLIAHSILQAKKSGLFDVIAVSSDSEKIRAVSQRWGADYVVERPLEMATSTAPKLPVIQHAVSTIEEKLGINFDVMVDLDATSPLRSIADVQESVKLLMNHPTAGNMITGFPSRRSPYFNMVEVNVAGFAQLAKKIDVPVTRRQDVPASYDMNASIYVWKREAFFQEKTVVNDRTLLYVMPEERSIDIDSPVDLQLVRTLAKHRKDLAWNE